MKRLFAFLLIAGLSACAAVTCPEKERDGGIGGTGDCSVPPVVARSEPGQ